MSPSDNFAKIFVSPKWVAHWHMFLSNVKVSTLCNKEASALSTCFKSVLVKCPISSQKKHILERSGLSATKFVRVRFAGVSSKHFDRFLSLTFMARWKRDEDSSRTQLLWYFALFFRRLVATSVSALKSSIETLILFGRGKSLMMNSLILLDNCWYPQTVVFKFLKDQ